MNVFCKEERYEQHFNMVCIFTSADTTRGQEIVRIVVVSEENVVVAVVATFMTFLIF